MSQSGEQGEPIQQQSSITSDEPIQQQQQQQQQEETSAPVQNRISRSASQSAEFLKSNAKIVATKVSDAVKNSRESIEKVTDAVKHSEAQHRLKEGIEKVTDAVKHSEAQHRLKEGFEKVSDAVQVAPHRVREGIEKVKEVIKGELKQESKPIYLDYNASTPTSPKVVQAMQPYLSDNYGNPGSSHYYGKQLKKGIDKARQQAASCLGCSPEEIIFTSGCTESNNLAIKGAIEHFYHSFKSEHKGLPHVITSTIEHAAVYEVCKHLERNGFCTVTYVGCDSNGLISVESVANAIKNETVLISIMHSNNEVGTLQPIKEIAEIAKQKSILMHTDCAQSMGKVVINVKDLGVSLLSLGGHKFYVPPGVGCLYVASGVEKMIVKQMDGLSQEYGLRAGTEAVMLIAAIGAGLELVEQSAVEWADHTRKLRNELWVKLFEVFGDNIRLNGPSDINDRRLPNTLSVGFKGLLASEIFDECKEIATSAGSACNSGTVKITRVLEEMKVPLEFARGTLRLSTGAYTTSDEITAAVVALQKAVQRINARKQQEQQEQQKQQEEQEEEEKKKKNQEFEQEKEKETHL